MDVMNQLHKQKLELINKLCITMLSEKRTSFYFAPNIKIDFIGTVNEMRVRGKYVAEVNNGENYIDMREIPVEGVLCVYDKVMDYFRDTTDIDDVEKEITRISNLPINHLVRYINNTVLPNMVDDIDERTLLTIYQMNDKIPWKGIEAIIGTVGLVKLVVDSFDNGLFSPIDNFFRYAEIDGPKVISFTETCDVWEEYGDMVSEYIRKTYRN